ncbi:MAG: universal stress protein [Kangiellaceae bacterium]|nr:universal stress protein [Kangiellaceae bacterium]
MNDKNKTKEALFTGRSIVACIDGSSSSEQVCDYASWIATAVDRPLKLIHTIEHNHNPAVSDYSGAIGLGSQQELLQELTDVEQSRSSLLIKKGQLMLNAAKDRASQAGVSKVETYQHHGTLAESLVEIEDEMRVMVIGIRGKEHEDQEKGIGHQLESVIRSMHKPILVVNKDFSQPKTTMLAYDGSASCKKALQMIASSKLFSGLPCHVVHVGSNAEALLDEATMVLEQAGIKATSVQLEGKVDEVLARYQAENDIELTLMGAFSHNRFRDLLLGSFTAKMLAATNRPLLLLR